MARDQINLTQEQINRIPTLIKSGKKPKDIAKSFGCTLRTVQLWVRRWHLMGELPKPIRGRPPMKLLVR